MKFMHTHHINGAHTNDGVSMQYMGSLNSFGKFQKRITNSYVHSQSTQKNSDSGWRLFGQTEILPEPPCTVNTHTHAAVHSRAYLMQAMSN